MSQTALKTKTPKPRKLKPFPSFSSDKEAEDFVDNADLTDYEIPNFRTFPDILADLNSGRENKTITLRMPTALLTMLKDTAKKQGIPYQHFLRLMLAKGMLEEWRS